MKQYLRIFQWLARLCAAACFVLAFAACGTATTQTSTAAATATPRPRATAQPNTPKPATPTRAPTARPATPTQAPTPPPATPTAQPATPFTDLPVIYIAELPPEAHTTLTLIAQGGPFPFERDGVVFQNRERLLPIKPGGYYHEYTVITPGESDRGARRIVTGAEGERFYTDDHYQSFSEVLP